MKFISTVLQIGAALLMIIFIMLFPVTLLGRGIARILFSTDGLVKEFSEAIIDADVFAAIAEELALDNATQSLDQSAEQQYLSQMMTNVSHDEWVEIIKIVAPTELLKTTTNSLFGEVFEWINGPEAYPDISVDLRQWKFNLQNSSIPIMEIVLEALPNCSTDDIRSFSSGEEIPFCKLPEPYYSELIADTSSDISLRLSEMPDEYVINESTLTELPGGGEAIRTAKVALQRSRSVLRMSWILVLGMFLVAIPLGARSISGAFKWFGMPLFLTGILTVILALAVINLGGVFISVLTGSIVSELPAALIAPVRVVFSGVIMSLGKPILSQGFLLMVVGAVGFVVGLVWRTVQNKASENNDPDVLDNNPSQNEVPEDDNSPTGMFG